MILKYSEETPYHVPQLFPLDRLPEGDEWLVEDVVANHVRRMPVGYRLHQMPAAGTRSGAAALCVVELGTGQTAESFSGVDVLRRAKEVFKAIALNRPFPFPAAVGDELEAFFIHAGDIILGDQFFSPELIDRGRFWAVPTMDRHPLLPSFVEQSSDAGRDLFIGLHITQAQGGLITDWRTERTEAIRRAFPFTGNRRLSFERQTVEGSSLLESAIEGPWYQLAREPEPFTRGAEVAEFLESQAGIEDGIAEILTQYPSFGEGDQIHWIGVRYASGEELRWLVIGIKARDPLTQEIVAEEGAGVRRDVLRDSRIFVLRVHRLSRQHLELRNAHTVAPTLASRTVVVIGCGALGSDVALTLAKAGIGKLVLVDYDRISVGNVIRHAAGLAAVGLAKPDAVRQLVRQHNPFVEVDTFIASATSPRQNIDEFLALGDLAVSTVADDGIDQIINEAAVRTQRVVVYGRALRSGTVARVLRVRPGTDACVQCAALYREANQRGEATGWLVIPAAPDELVTRECGQAILAASAADLRFAADFTARAVLDELSGGAGWNNLLWVREPWHDAPPTVSAYSIVRATFSQRQDCPVCTRPRVRAIEISSEAAAALRRHAESKPRVETGGALIGYEDNGVVRVVEVTDSGPGAIETPTRFQYDAAHVNARLMDAHERLGSRGVYVGEWHTHIERQPRPSPMDVASLTDIAGAPNILTNEPIMLIAGLDPDTGRVALVHGSSFPINRAMQTLPLNGWYSEG
ncbi:MAG: ThiF family adenylyltransferase [Gemmatimonadaceae bacterium]